MKCKAAVWKSLLVLVFLFAGLGQRVRAQGTFSLVIGQPSPPPVFLVAHGDTWWFHEGTNAPAPGWQTNADSSLDGSWASGPGGFGYADNTPEVALVRTPLLDMQNRYTTFYIRRSFEITNEVAPQQALRLVMDWDDGFVAWLDGVELAPRSNAPGTAGTEPSFNSTATTSHESSLGNNLPQPAMTFSLGPSGARLQPGTHVLAILGLNQATNSSDFILVPELLVGDANPSGVVNGTLLSIVRSNSVVVSGTNSIANSARVLVDGIEADYDPGTGRWSRTVSLTPGFNRVLFQAFDSAGVQLFATNREIVSELVSTNIGGTLNGDISLRSSMGIFHVTNSIRVPSGASLSIGAGCVFLLSPGASFDFTASTLSASGAESGPIVFAPADGTTVWGGLIGTGTGAQLHGQHVETIAGHLELLNGAEGTFEDSYFHDYTVSSPAIIHTLGDPNHCSLTLRRCHVNRYYEMLCQLSTNRFEECLMEYPEQGGDGIDFDGGQPGSFIRRCTVRHGRYTNVDALDMGEYAGGEPSRGVLIENCLLYDFVDKGVSMGVQVDVCVSNCLIHHVDSGIAVKDLSLAGIYNCTIVSNNFGFHCYNKANPASSTGGGFITNSFNNILWGNTQSFELLNGSTLTASYSDFQGTSVPGAGNVSLDPTWRAAASGDYSLAPTSPLWNAALDGAAMGAAFPVGAAMASSHPAFSSLEVTGDTVVLRFWADSERAYSLVASDVPSGTNWARVADIFPTPLPRTVAITNGIANGAARFFRLATPRLP
ncbi:MAG TPA: right-handed parallel beta-helix repeat-containing protein [Verrucomicrobiae bacterium]